MDNMVNKYFLLRMVISGIKNIDKEVELDFYKKTLPKYFNYRDYNVKAIYGANGAGKTAIIYAAEIYKQFVLDKDYLSFNIRNSNLSNLINQKTHKLKIEMTFAKIANDNSILCVYSHLISFRYENETLTIQKEVLKKLKGNRLNETSKYDTVFETNNGELLDNTNDTNAFLVDISKNVLQDRSVESNVFMHFINNRDIIRQEKFADIISAYLFAQNLTVVINGTDKNYININYLARQINTISKAEKEYGTELLGQMLAKGKLAFAEEIIINKKMYPTFKKDTINLCHFIQIFKSDLKDIEIKTDEMLDNYVCTLNFVYDDGKKIAMQYESTGIKKFMILFYALRDIENGKIVFIDEFDANIHDVVLVKLVEYIQNYTDGQFVFTTHNLGPMDLLQNAKHSIDFLSNDSHLTPWTKIGNCSAANVYKKGLIKYSPFNIESFDFLGVFNNESNQ